MSKTRIYLDYAATTPLDKRVEKAMRPFLANTFGNPSSIHAEGVAAKKALDTARTTVARCLEAHAEEIVFTSGGTEANNLAILGVLSPLIKGALEASKVGLYLSEKQPPPRRLGTPFAKGDKPHVITTNIEHASVLEPLRQLEKEGKAEVTYVPVEPNGIVKAERIIAAIKPNTVLVSVMYANNEIGTVQPIRKIGQLLSSVKGSASAGASADRRRSKVKGRGKSYPIFHVDACQAPLYLRCLVNALSVDLLSLDAHKIYGPKGVGALYVRRNTPITPVMLGGGQERGLRSTTENVAGIVGFAEAFRIATSEKENESARVKKLRDHLHSVILKNNRMEMVVNGSMEEGERLPNNLNISFPGIDTEFLTLQLDAAGIAVSTKSSCLKDEKESYVVAALGGSRKRARSSLRFTLGRGTAKKDVEIASKELLRLLSAKH